VSVSVDDAVPVAPEKDGRIVDALHDPVTPVGRAPTDSVTSVSNEPPAVTVNASVVVAP